MILSIGPVRASHDSCNNAMTGDFVSRRSDRMDVVRYGMDDELLKLKCN